MKKFLLSVMAAVLTCVSGSAATGFHTSGTKLLDANGNEFVMRGVNYSYAWQKGNESTVIPAAKRQGCNCVRIQISDGTKFGPATTADEVTKLIKLCEDNKLVCILNIQDELGVDDISALMRAANYWANNLASAVKGHESTTIVNIENEWDATWESDNWAKGYEQAIPALRNAGIANTLMIDCAGYGQYPNAIWEKGADVLAADKLSNTMFSIHMYEWASYEQPATATGSKVKTSIDKALGVNAPLVIGEFGYKHKDGAVDYQTIMDYCTEKNVGYLGWSWTGNGGGVEFLDMFSDYTDNNMEENGKIIILGKNGIKETSKECSVFGGTTTPVVPVVPVDPVTPTSTGFHISGTKLLDANGNNFIMRGVNYSYAWQHGDCSIAQSVISAAKRQKANCIRINLSDGEVYAKTSAAELTKLIQLCKNYNLIAIVNTHDETGSSKTKDLEKAVAYWKEMKEILNANTAYVIVNVSNEWYGPWESDPWAAGYVTAIKELRDAGIKNTLLIDCAGYGQYPQSIVDKGSTVLAADADKNTLFAIHMYEYAAPDATPDKVNTAIDGALGIGAPVVIGEFGYAHSGNKIAYQRIMDYCKEKGVGYMGWSWTGNDAANAELDMFADYTDSNIKENGKLIINGTNGIAATSTECSVFSNHSIVTTTIDVCPSSSSTTDTSSSVIWSGNFNAGSWTNLLAIDGSYFNNAKAGQQLVFKTSSATGEIQIDYGTESSFEKIVDYDNFTNGTYTLTLTDENIAQLKKGLIVKGHDYTLTSVEISSSSKGGGNTGGVTCETVDFALYDTACVWRGKVDLGSWTNFASVSGDRMCDAQVGDALYIQYAISADATDKKPAELQISNWRLGKCLAKTGEEPYVIVSNCDHYVLNISDADVLETIKTAELPGIRIKGQNCTITAIYLIAKKGTNSDIAAKYVAKQMDKTTLNCMNGWGSADDILKVLPSNEVLATAKVGDKIRINFSDYKTDPSSTVQVQLAAMPDYTYLHDGNTKNPECNGSDCYYFKIETAEDLKLIKQGFCVKGNGVQIGSIDLLVKSADASDIENVDSDRIDIIDFSKPYDVYNVYGQKLNHIGNAGEHRIYILHQNGKTFKLMR